MKRSSILFAAAIGALVPMLADMSSADASLVGMVRYAIALPGGAAFSFGQNPTYLDTNVADQTVGGGTPTGAAGMHALLYAGATGTLTDLNPTNLTGFSTSFADATFASQQAGYGSGTATSNNNHALLWSGTGDSAVDLNPASLGITKSYAYGTNGSQQVGYGSGGGTGNRANALLWNGSAASAINLDPNNISTSFAYATNDLKQVGYGYGTATSNHAHAFLWSGNAGSAIDLTPAGITFAYAYGIGGNQQVGYDVASNGNSHAILWTGSAGSAVDLNPTNLAGIGSSYAYDCNGAEQIGYGTGSGTANNDHALLWSGSAGSAVDLQSLLPVSGSWVSSHPSAIDSSGNVYGIANGTYNGVTGYFAVQWAASTAITVASGQVYHFPSGSTAGINIVAVDGGLTINATGTAIVDPAGNHTNRQLLVISGSGLTLAGATGNWTAKLDLGNNDLDVAGASLAIVNDQVRQGFNSAGVGSGGTWEGTGGITSSPAAADSKHLMALGVIQNNQGGAAVYGPSNLFDGHMPQASDILIKYTYFGDANLDGQVDGSDYTRIDNGYLNHLSGWYNGDFNYDGVVDGSDYTLMDNAFNTQGANLATSAEQVRSTNELSDSSPESAAVPEPSAAEFAGLAAASLLRRRQSKGPRRSECPPVKIRLFQSV